MLDEQENKVHTGRQINFTYKSSFFPTDGKTLWKVRNDDISKDPRGEISRDKTRNNPEPTKYIGNHYVEAYLILNGDCIEKYRQPVIIEE